MTSLLIVTAFVFLGFYFLFVKLKLDRPHQKFILAGLWSFGQIILSQLFLGITGQLYLPVLIVINIGITSVILFYARIFERNTFAIVQQEFLEIEEGLKNAFSIETASLFILLGLVMAWMAIAIYFFPPVHNDEVKYHLPPIYEYIINHKIFLLPVTINARFAFPENAELLFMWPVIFSHSQQLVNSVQLVVALWGGIVIYGMARMLEIPSKISLFVSLLFLMTPVVLFQMGSCYIDIITGIFILTVLYSAGKYNKTKRLCYFYSAALAAGLLWGMKYNEILFILMALPFLFVKSTIRPRHWAGFIIIFLTAGGFWYLRNFIIFKTPIYPVPFSKDSLYIYTAHPANVTLFGFFTNIPYKLLLLWKDVSLVNLNGGYGLVFWGLALPAWFYVWTISIVQNKKFNFWIYSFLITGLGQLILITLKDFVWIERYSLFVVALGLLSLGQVLVIFDAMVFFRKAIKALCIMFAVLAVVRLSDNNYRIDIPVKAYVKGKYLTRENYDPYHSNIWGILDYLTIGDAKGLSCYISTTTNYNWNVISSAYGMKLQNRIWVLQKDRAQRPDAFIYYNVGENKKLKKDEPMIPLKDMINNPDYLLVLKTQESYIFIRKNYFNSPQKRQLLDKYFKTIGQSAPIIK